MHKYREQLNTLLVEQSLLQKNLVGYEARKEELQELAIHLEQAQQIFQNASKLLYDNLSVQLGKIITEGLSIVFPEANYSFVIDFVDKRGTIEAELYLEDNEGHRYHPTDAVGGGVADFISILLRITFIVLSGYENVLVADEPVKFIDRDKIPLAANFIKKVCNDFGLQLIMVTHIPEMVDVAECVYKVTKSKGQSKLAKIR